MIWIWVGVIVATILLEFFTTAFVSIWFTVGAVVGLVLEAFGVSPEIQVATFFIVALVSLVFFRKICLRLFKDRSSATNADAIIGEKLKLITGISPDVMGTARVHDVVWNCNTPNEDVIEAGAYVIVKEIKGNKLIVTKYDN